MQAIGKYPYTCTHVLVLEEGYMIYDLLVDTGSIPNLFDLFDVVGIDHWYENVLPSQFVQSI